MGRPVTAVGMVRAHWFQAAIAGALLLQPVGLWLFGEMAAPVAMPRTFLPAAIGFAAFVGVAIASLPRAGGSWVGTACVGLSLTSALMLGTVRHKEQWAGAAAVTENAPVIVTCANWKTPSFLARSRGTGWVITSYGDHALVVREPGDTATWDRLYFDRVQRYGHYPLRRERALRLEPRPIIADRLLFVASECSKVERDAFAQWASPRQSRTLWSSPRTEDAADIRVEEWRLDGAAPLDLWIVR